jgi:hypothetical protein
VLFRSEYGRTDEKTESVHTSYDQTEVAE